MSKDYLNAEPDSPASNLIEDQPSSATGLHIIDRSGDVLGLRGAEGRTVEAAVKTIVEKVMRALAFVAQRSGRIRCLEGTSKPGIAFLVAREIHKQVHLLLSNDDPSVAAIGREVVATLRLIAEQFADIDLEPGALEAKEFDPSKLLTRIDGLGVFEIRVLGALNNRGISSLIDFYRSFNQGGVFNHTGLEEIRLIGKKTSVDIAEALVKEGVVTKEGHRYVWTTQFLAAVRAHQDREAAPSQE